MCYTRLGIGTSRRWAAFPALEPQPNDAVPPPLPPPIAQVTRLTLCTLEVFLRRRTDAGGAVDAPAPADLATAVLGADLPAVFPEARVKRACARGVLPPTEVASG